MSERRRIAFPELYFGEVWIYYISKLLALSLCERATDDPRTKEAMSPKEDSSECNSPVIHHTPHSSKSKVFKTTADDDGSKAYMLVI